MLLEFGLVLCLLIYCTLSLFQRNRNLTSIFPQGLGPIGQCVVQWAKLKGASRVIGIDTVPERLAFAEKHGIETINFKEYTDVPKRIAELIPGGLDVGLDAGTFHEPKTLLHKVQKKTMLETDVPETINEMLLSVRKRGSCGLISDYVGHANGVNVGALMEKGIRLIGNGQSPVHKYWKEILYDYIIPGKFDPTLCVYPSFLRCNSGADIHCYSIITHRVPLEEMDKLYAAFDKRKNGVIKVFVETQFSSPPSRGCPTRTHVYEWKD
jgi:threonine dehydrogenase-like Zn-dependent dehydrogenase